MKQIYTKFTVFSLVFLLLFGGWLQPVHSYANSDDIWNVQVTGNGESVNLGTTTSSQGESINKVLTKYRGLIVGLSAVGAITMLAIFIILFMKLGATATNPQERAKVIHGMIYSAFATAGLGAISIFVGFFYGMLAG